MAEKFRKIEIHHIWLNFSDSQSLSLRAGFGLALSGRARRNHSERLIGK
jgi:hypothetical protein